MTVSCITQSLLTVTHPSMCTLPRCAISQSFDGLPARLDVLGSRPDHRRVRAFELSPRSSQLPWRSSPRFLAMYLPAEMLQRIGKDSIRTRQTALEDRKRPCGRKLTTAEPSRLQGRVHRSVASSYAVIDASSVFTAFEASHSPRYANNGISPSSVPARTFSSLS